MSIIYKGLITTLVVINKDIKLCINKILVGYNSVRFLKICFKH